ncbi:hypothetical protein CW358_11790 [Pseudomonas protegens]|nr:hypothetical protein CW358_11790 [Pseudomonas protegens]
MRQRVIDGVSSLNETCKRWRIISGRQWAGKGYRVVVAGLSACHTVGGRMPLGRRWSAQVFQQTDKP